MKQLIKALFAVAVINLLIYAFYSLAFIFVLPSFRSFGLVAISIGLIAFFIARTFYKLFDYDGKDKSINRLLVLNVVILILLNIFTTWLKPLLLETVTNIGQVYKYKKYKAGKAPIENGVWEYKKTGVLMPQNELLVSCKDGKIDGTVIFNHFDKDDGFKVDYYSAGELDSTTFWQNKPETDSMYLTETRIETDTFFYVLDFENIEMEVQKIGINEKGDTILNVKSPVISEIFDVYNRN